MSGRLLRSVAFVAVAALVSCAVEAQGVQARSRPSKMLEKSALSSVWSWLIATVGLLPSVPTVSIPPPADGTDAGWQMDPNGTPDPV
jgi:hypothetical protein